ncbi:MAG: hypothetical protein Q8Q42_04060 [Nanoarchaeota archaeon]|nr:hypothetical protein [Nanoarchaeota archaeon]
MMNINSAGRCIILFLAVTFMLLSFTDAQSNNVICTGEEFPPIDIDNPRNSEERSIIYELFRTADRYYMAVTENPGGISAWVVRQGANAAVPVPGSGFIVYIGDKGWKELDRYLDEESNSVVGMILGWAGKVICTPSHWIYIGEEAAGNSVASGVNSFLYPCARGNHQIPDEEEMDVGKIPFGMSSDQVDEYYCSQYSKCPYDDQSCRPDTGFCECISDTPVTCGNGVVETINDEQCDPPGSSCTGFFYGDVPARCNNDCRCIPTVITGGQPSSSLTPVKNPFGTDGPITSPSTCGNGMRNPGEECNEPGLSCSREETCVISTCKCIPNEDYTGINPTTLHPDDEPDINPTGPSTGAGQTVSAPVPCGSGEFGQGDVCQAPGNCKEDEYCATSLCVCRKFPPGVVPNEPTTPPPDKPKVTPTPPGTGTGGPTTRGVGYCGDEVIQQPNSFGVYEQCEYDQVASYYCEEGEKCDYCECVDDPDWRPTVTITPGGPGTDTGGPYTLPSTSCGDGIIQNPNDQGQYEECELNANCQISHGSGWECISCVCQERDDNPTTTITPGGSPRNTGGPGSGPGGGGDKEDAYCQSNGKAPNTEQDGSGDDINNFNTNDYVCIPTSCPGDKECNDQCKCPPVGDPPKVTGSTSPGGNSQGTDASRSEDYSNDGSSDFFNVFEGDAGTNAGRAWSNVMSALIDFFGF